jgi:dolichol-phosphate mannosyltransferase
VQSTPDATLILIPTYNEASSIEAVVREVLDAVHCDVLILDDNSPDGTGQIADRLAAENARVTVEHRAGKEGLAAAGRKRDEPHLHGRRVRPLRRRRRIGCGR